MNAHLLELSGLSKSFGGVHALRDFSCSVDEGEVVGLIGPNGAGKTTLFNVISGFVQPDSGEVKLAGRALGGKPPHRIALMGVARTFQDLRLIGQLSALDNVLLAFTGRTGEGLQDALIRPFATSKRERQILGSAVQFLDKVGLGERLHTPAHSLSYGQQKLLSLARCLATQAHLVLLDEPVAGIAPQTTEAILGIVRDLSGQGRAVMFIEHNLDAAASVCDRVVFMDAGTKVTEGTAEQVRQDPRVIAAYLG